MAEVGDGCCDVKIIHVLCMASAGGVWGHGDCVFEYLYHSDHEHDSAEWVSLVYAGCGVYLVCRAIFHRRSSGFVVV